MESISKLNIGFHCLLHGVNHARFLLIHRRNTYDVTLGDTRLYPDQTH